MICRVAARQIRVAAPKQAFVGTGSLSLKVLLLKMLLETSEKRTGGRDCYECVWSGLQAKRNQVHVKADR